MLEPGVNRAQQRRIYAKLLENFRLNYFEQHSFPGDHTVNKLQEHFCCDL